MAGRRRQAEALLKAKKFSEFLLWRATGGSMGTAPEKSTLKNDFTLSEMRGLLDSLIRIADIERKEDDEQEEVSGLDIIKKDIAKRKKANDGKKAGNRGNNWGKDPAESRADEPVRASTGTFTDAETEEDEDGE